MWCLLQHASVWLTQFTEGCIPRAEAHKHPKWFGLFNSCALLYISERGSLFSRLLPSCKSCHVRITLLAEHARNPTILPYFRSILAIGHFADPLVCSPPCFGADLDHMGFVQALLTVLLPTSFFFIFLYYTDIGALTFFLAAYWVNPISGLLQLITLDPLKFIYVLTLASSIARQAFLATLPSLENSSRLIGWNWERGCLLLHTSSGVY